MKREIVKFVRKLFGTEYLVNVAEALLRNTQAIMNAQLFRGIIEDCEWLKYKSFAPGGMALDNAALYTLFRILNDVKPKNILEFGLGQSSKMIHQYSTFSENVAALTIEHDIQWINFFCNGISKNININIKQFDLETVNYNGVDTLSYKDIDRIISGGGGGMIL